MSDRRSAAGGRGGSVKHGGGGDDVRGGASDGSHGGGGDRARGGSGGACGGARNGGGDGVRGGSGDGVRGGSGNGACGDDDGSRGDWSCDGDSTDCCALARTAFVAVASLTSASRSANRARAAATRCSRARTALRRRLHGQHLSRHFRCKTRAACVAFTRLAFIAFVVRASAPLAASRVRCTSASLAANRVRAAAARRSLALTATKRRRHGQRHARQARCRALAATSSAQCAGDRSTRLACSHSTRFSNRSRLRRATVSCAIAPPYGTGDENCSLRRRDRACGGVAAACPVGTGGAGCPSARTSEKKACTLITSAPAGVTRGGDSGHGALGVAADTRGGACGLRCKSSAALVATDMLMSRSAAYRHRHPSKSACDGTRCPPKSAS